MSSISRIPNVTVAECLETLEDSMCRKKSRSQAFQNLHLILQEKDYSETVTKQEVLRILSAFQKCLKLDIQCIPHSLTAVISLLSNAKVISNIPAEDLLPSMLGVLHMIKTLSALETQNLRTMGVQVLLSYPVDVLTMIIRHNCSEVLEIFQDFTPPVLQVGSKTFYTLLKGLLIRLPPEEKEHLVQTGIPVWLKGITVIMNTHITQDDDLTLEDVKCLEVLTEALVEVDYSQSSHWQNEVLKCICIGKIYPTTIMRHLQRNSGQWHRIWIVFVKLLKNQITRNSPFGTPIQPMLEIVETAFKMDANNRSRAFQCWDVLIDSLSSDTNAKSIPRYLKLLLIPLKPNNAKTEATARTKLYTWWNLVRKFQPKLDQFTNEVLFEFLHFMFGKKVNKTIQTVVGAGQAYDSMKTLCLQAFAEIVGHDGNCNCCSDLPRLNEKMLNNKLLASHWDEWMAALKTAIVITNSIFKTDKYKITGEPLQVLCVWKAFVISIAELPPNGVRKDMFNELIQVLIDLLQVSDDSDSLPGIIFSLTLSLTEDNETIKKLVGSKGDELPLHKIMTIILNPKMQGVFERCDTQRMVEILRPFTDFAVNTVNLMTCLDYLMYVNSSLKVWTALALSVSEAQMVIDPDTVKNLLMWPLLASKQIHVDQNTATTWQTLYNIFTTISSRVEFDRDVIKSIENGLEGCNSQYFRFFVVICVLKKRLLCPHDDVSRYLRILERLTAGIVSDYKQYEQAVPMLVDTTVVMINRAISSEATLAIASSLNCVKNILQMFFSEIKSEDSQASKAIDDNILIMLDNIFRALQPVSKTSLHSRVFCGFLDFLKEYAIPLDKESALFKCILSKLRSLQSDYPTDRNNTKINDCIAILMEDPKTASSTSNDMSKAVKVFTSPNVSKVVKRSKKKEAVIVNTVTENGEEYAVVKSNWKFNPKKLTENQKEKLQRKREDIPALYQDLSQSQDEFKLSKWKTDSQDTTTSSNSKSSKLTTNEDASNILKNIPSSDVVPNIMQNILSETDKNHTNISNETNNGCIQTDQSAKVVRLSLSTPKSTKSPRMALKDRVFRNVRNLIEKSSPKNDTTNAIVSEDQLKRTPPAKSTNNTNIINSAPPLISADRPSRVRRIPKKFEDVQLFGLRKRRHSQTDCLSQGDIENIDDLNRDDEDKNTEKAKLAKLSIDNSNEVNDQIVLEHCDVIEVEEADPVQDAQELIVVPESQHESINKGALDNTITENLCGTQNNELISDIQENNNEVNIDNSEHDNQKEHLEKNDDSQELQKNDEEIMIPKESVVLDIRKNAGSPQSQNNYDVQDDLMDVDHDSLKNKLEDKVKDTVDLNNETENQNKEIVTLKTPVRKVKDTVDISNEIEDQNKEIETLKTSVRKVKDTVDLNNETEDQNKEIVTLKTPIRKTKEAPQKSTAKKSVTKKSRIEKELAIDMVEGHPFLKVQTEKRLTRKTLIESENASRRRSVPDNSNKIKAQPKTSPKTVKKAKEKECLSNQMSEPCLVTVEETQERNTLPEDAPCSEDVIESSQDSSFTTITVKSTKRTPKRQPVVSVERLEGSDPKITETQDLLQESDCEMICVTNISINQETKDDIELPQNKTVEVDKNQSELTDNMDTEPVIDEKIIDDVIILNDRRESPITISSEKSVGLESQELAEADTQPNDPGDFIEYESNEIPQTHPEVQITHMDMTESMSPSKLASATAPESQDIIEISTEPNCSEKDTDICSPFKDDVRRKQDFLNNTFEISPIKVQSPDKDKTSPEKNEETSSDYLVVKLSSPVHSNGEPFTSKGSPEFFTEDKTSPDKRDQSPPRAEVVATLGSPSSSLSLKKNRPQTLRPGGRAAHMVGLCVPDSISTKKNPDKADTEEPRKHNTSTPARRNLRVLYNAVSDNSDISEDAEQENFLKLKKTLPAVDSSPAVPILKRKIDVMDDTTASPASKRKRVSFHDPPVSTTVSVQKYIKPDCIEPPTQKRIEPLLTRSSSKTPKKLDNAIKLDNTAIKLDTILSKAIESFKEPADSLTNDTNTSLDVTPAVEVVITSELNDSDPICQELIDCKDSIENIAAELSSPAMKDLFIKELNGRVLTVGDLAKMTELEVNRLRIKAPKVQIAKKVLADYVNKRVVTQDMPSEAMVIVDETAIAVEMNEVMTESEALIAVETQTDGVSVCETSSQTRTNAVKLVATQTPSVSTTDVRTQTLESGFRTTSEVITSCLSEREDFLEKLGELLPLNTTILRVNKSDDSTSSKLDPQSQSLPNDDRNTKELSVVKDFLLERLDHRGLMLFCSRLLQGACDKSA